MFTVLSCQEVPVKISLRLLVVSSFFISVVLAQTPSGFIAHNISDLKFAVGPDGTNCFTMAVEKGDPAKEASFMVMRGKAGCAVPAHWHPSTETILIAKGTARADMRDGGSVMLRPKSFLSVPPKHVMSFRCITECELLLHTDGPFIIHYVDASGNEISTAKALGK
jgi:quercetin dioxygenase-like cupin family protein